MAGARAPAVFGLAARVQEGQLDFPLCAVPCANARGRMPAAHQQPRPTLAKSCRRLGAGTMSDVSRQTLQTARRNGGIDCR